MKALLLFLNLVLITLAAVAASNVTFKTTAEVSDQNIELGEVAFVTEESISNLILDKSPSAVGESIIWTADELSKKLHPYQDLLKDIQFKLPSLIKITRVDAEFSLKALEEKIKQALRGNIPAEWEIKISNLQKPQWPNVSNKASWNVVAPLNRPKGPTQFEIIISDLNKKPQRIWVNAHVEFFADVITATTSLSARERIGVENTRVENKNITHLSDLPLAKFDLDGALSKYNLAEGTILTKKLIDKEFAVKFGEEVEVIIGNQNFSVSSKGIAQQNAHVGDSIKVRTNQNIKTISGEVIGKKQVKVSL
ncbi:MAG: flagellar basal body P-ring formation protein FlgA [Oligoflexia bacterium]|nr:flagellar basal body P-ring formation protein FlgA [Oligoflexia bacterium]